jgi:hypothetical protein
MGEKTQGQGGNKKRGTRDLDAMKRPESFDDYPKLFPAKEKNG